MNNQQDTYNKSQSMSNDKKEYKKDNDQKKNGDKDTNKSGSYGENGTNK